MTWTNFLFTAFVFWAAGTHVGAGMHIGDEVQVMPVEASASDCAQSKKMAVISALAVGDKASLEAALASDGQTPGVVAPASEVTFTAAQAAAIALAMAQKDKDKGKDEDEDLAAAAAAADTATEPGHPADELLPIGWDSGFDPKYGRTYYYQVTGGVDGPPQWEYPMEKGAGTTIALHAAMAAAGTEAPTTTAASDTTAGATTAASDTTAGASGTTVAVVADAETAPAASGPIQAAPAHPSDTLAATAATSTLADEELPAGWESGFDSKYGKPYYYQVTAQGEGPPQWKNPGKTAYASPSEIQWRKEHGYPVAP
jgi:hypothetical protein